MYNSIGVRVLTGKHEHSYPFKSILGGPIWMSIEIVKVPCFCPFESKIGYVSLFIDSKFQRDSR